MRLCESVRLCVCAWESVSCIETSFNGFRLSLLAQGIVRPSPAAACL